MNHSSGEFERMMRAFGGNNSMSPFAFGLNEQDREKQAEKELFRKTEKAKNPLIFWILFPA